MRLTKQKTIVIFLMIALMSNFNMVKALDNGNYFSTELKEGTVLEWSYALKNLHLNPITTEAYTIQITILKDIGDVAINDANYAEYFDYSAASASPSLDVSTFSLISSYIYPTVKVIEGESLTYYEYYEQEVANPPKYEISKQGSDIVINTDTGTGGDEFTNEIIIHESTGIIKEKNFRGYISLYEVEWTIEVEYLGGLDLAKGEIAPVIILFTCVALFQVVRKRKRKKT